MSEESRVFALVIVFAFLCEALGLNTEPPEGRQTLSTIVEFCGRKQKANRKVR